jgi:hypothetical protein
MDAGTAGDHITGPPDTGTDYSSSTGELYPVSVANRIRRAQTYVPAGPQLELQPIPQFLKRSLPPRRVFCWPVQFSLIRVLTPPTSVKPSLEPLGYFSCCGGLSPTNTALCGRGGGGAASLQWNVNLYPKGTCITLFRQCHGFTPSLRALLLLVRQASMSVPRQASLKLLGTDTRRRVG